MDSTIINQISPNEKTVFDEIFPAKTTKSTFDLSHNYITTGDFGILYPVLCQETVPGDRWEIETQAVLRMQPMVAPVLQEIQLYVHYFFVPYRLLDENFTKWLVGPKPGDPQPPSPPRWNPTPAEMQEGSLWDYLGFPTGLTASPAGATPLDYPRRAYNLIWNEYYRDINLQNEVSLTNSNLLRRNWKKDYFTAALPWQQRGVPPAMALSGIANLNPLPNNAYWINQPNNQSILGIEYFNNTDDRFQVSNTNARQNFNSNIQNHWSVNLSSSGGQFTLPDLRALIVIQQWQERNARGGTRYIEYLRAHFGIAPDDKTLQRPEYFGGIKAPVMVQDVVQTSQTQNTPQGTLAGKGTIIDYNNSGSIKIEEYGLIMGLISVMPTAYYSQGINRQWLRETRFDFYNPLFANLSEQPIKRAEIYTTTSSSTNNDIFGYQGRYDELRFIPSMFTAKMRSTYDYWHLGRKFSNMPNLNSSFLECNPGKRILAVQSEPAFVVSIGFRIRAQRPLPALAMPGLDLI